MADVAVALAPRLNQQRVIVAIHQHRHDGEAIAGGFTLHPQGVSGAGEKCHVSALPRPRQRDVVHEADHQDFVRFGILHDGGNQSIEF